MKYASAVSLGAAEPRCAHDEELRPLQNGAVRTRAYTVFIRDCSVSTVIGVHEHERTQPLALLMDLDIEIAASTAGETDRIGDTVDYAVVVDRIRRELADKRYFLLERLAEFVADLVLEAFGALRVRLKVAKTGIIPGVGQVGVVINRAREPRSGESRRGVTDVESVVRERKTAMGPGR